MLKRSRTGKPDVNQMATNPIDAITGELSVEQSDPNKNPATVALGRLGSQEREGTGGEAIGTETETDSQKSSKG